MIDLGLFYICVHFMSLHLMKPSLSMSKWRKKYALEWQTVLELIRGFWCLWINRYQNNTRVGAETVCHKSTCINLFLTWHNVSINDDKNNNFITSYSCLTRSIFILLMTSQSIADDVTLTSKFWCDHMNNDISPVDIDFIQGDIQGLLCKKIYIS